jgi:hypothetical protein
MRIYPTNKTAKLRKNASEKSVFEAVCWDIATRHDQVYGKAVSDNGYVNGEYQILVRWREELKKHLGFPEAYEIESEIWAHIRKARKV